MKKHTATLDTSFWVNVQRVGLLPHVQSRYRLCYAPDVAGEMSTSSASGREFWRLARGGFLTEVVAEHDQVTEFGPGERAAINLALEHPDWILLLDDQKPYQEAVQRGLRVLCSSVLVAAMFSEGALDATRAMIVLARLATLQTVSPHLLAAAIAHVGRSWKLARGA